ncbi:hypothetical protein D3C73_639980 [compost metagenome]
MVVVQVLVGVVVVAPVQAHVGPEFGLGYLDVLLVGALAIPLLHDLGAVFQRHQLQVVDALGQGRQLGFGGIIGQHHLATGGQGDEGGEFGPGELEILAALIEQGNGIDEGALVGQRLLARQQALRLGLAGRVEGHPGSGQQLVDLGQQALGPQGTPVGAAHILQHVLGHLATALFGHQHLIPLLLVAVIGDAEIEQTPAQPQTAQIAVALLGGGGAQALLTVLDPDRGAT